MNKLEAIEDRVSHHVYFYLSIDGNEHRVGKLSHSFRGQATDHVIADTARRLKLRKPEFVSLVDCTMDRQQHEVIWRERDP